MKNTFKKAVRRWMKMAKANGRGDKPDFKGTLDVAAWFNTDKDGKTYLSVVLGNRAKLVPNGQKLEDHFE